MKIVSYNIHNFGSDEESGPSCTADQEHMVSVKIDCSSLAEAHDLIAKLVTRAAKPFVAGTAAAATPAPAIPQSATRLVKPPPPAPKAPPPPVDEDEDGEEIEFDVTEEMKGATKLRELIELMQAAGVDTREKLLAVCESVKAQIPVLMRIVDIKARVTKACELMQIE